MSRTAEAAFGDDLFSYPRSPGHKEQTTSREAAMAVAGDAAVLRERAYAALAEAGERGLTADGVAKVLRRDRLSVRPRISELRATGRIIPTGERRKNESGLRAKIWRIA